MHLTVQLLLLLRLLLVAGLCAPQVHVVIADDAVLSAPKQSGLIGIPSRKTGGDGALVVEEVAVVGSGVYVTRDFCAI